MIALTSYTIYKHFNVTQSMIALKHHSAILAHAHIELEINTAEEFQIQVQTSGIKIDCKQDNLSAD
uniref:Uncharacterized protein n=1 Tax=Arion vulgaris TaxID=1028688 RepID=A0A0B6ZLP4_9EUPU